VTYRIVLRKLTKMPQERRRLAHGNFWDRKMGCGCALGTVIPEAKRHAMKVDHSFSFPDDIVEMFGFGPLENVGLSLDEANVLFRVNDRITDNYETERDRYERVVKWLRERVKEEKQAMKQPKRECANV
jgi:hypothetical protein